MADCCGFNMTEMESTLHNNGFKFVAGVDEAGRGPLAGPVFAAAVVMSEDKYIPDIKDSKKLSEKKRELIYDYIIENADFYAVASVDEGEIDEINILNATHKAMNKAVSDLKIKPDYVLIDGNSIKNMDIPHETVVKGDAKVACIAAASILAKVSRDRYIRELADKFPEYNFAKHKGYGTAEHVSALKKYGPCPIHRRSFLKKILGDNL